MVFILISLEFQVRFSLPIVFSLFTIYMYLFYSYLWAVKLLYHNSRFALLSKISGGALRNYSVALRYFGNIWSQIVQTKEENDSVEIERFVSLGKKGLKWKSKRHDLPKIELVFRDFKVLCRTFTSENADDFFTV